MTMPNWRRFSLHRENGRLLRSVRLAELPALQNLSLPSYRANPHLTDESFENLSSFRKLAELNLDHAQVTDKTLARLFKLPNFRHGNFYRTLISDEAIGSFSKNASGGRVWLYK